MAGSSRVDGVVSATGMPVARNSRSGPAPKELHDPSRGDAVIPPFMFATGIENSYPTIDGGAIASTRWRSAATTSSGATTSTASRSSASASSATGRRCTAPGSGRGATTGTSPTTFGELLRRDITPIADLCHFGVPDWLGNFQNPDFPALFADYARAFAERYRWVQLYTPVNEMFICATFSASYGWWNEQLHDRPRLRHRAEAPRPGQRPGDAGDPRASARTRSSSRANRRSTSTPTAPRRSRRPRSLTRSASSRST